MLPIVVAVLCLVAVKTHGQQPAVKHQQPATHECKAVKDLVTSPKPLVSKTVPPVQPPRRATVFREVSELQKAAQLFITKYLQLPYVERVYFPQDKVGDLHRPHTYTQRFQRTQDNPLWQICAISSPFGAIYLSLRLSDQLTVPADTEGVLITYDDPATEERLSELKEEQLQRFGRTVFQYDKVVQNEDMLRWFLGDNTYPHPVGTYLVKGDTTFV